MEGVVEAPVALVARVAEVDVGGERDLLLLGHLALAHLDHPASVPVRVLLADDLLDVGLDGPLRRRVQHDGDADRAHVRPLPSRGVLHLVRLARRKVGTKVARLAGRRRLVCVDEAGVLQAAVPRLPPRAPAMQNVGLRRPGTGRERGVSSEEPSYKRGVQRGYKGGTKGCLHWRVSGWAAPAAPPGTRARSPCEKTCTEASLACTSPPPLAGRLQGAVGQLRQGVDRLAAQGRRERRCHHQQRVRAREAQRHQDVEAGGQGERRGGAPSREA